MASVVLHVVAEPHDPTKTVFAPGGRATTVVYGPSRGQRYVCGSCGATLIMGISPEQLTGLVVRCAACGAFNEYAEPSA